MKIIADYRSYRIKLFHVLNTICKEKEVPHYSKVPCYIQGILRQILGDQRVCSDPGQSQLPLVDLQLGSARVPRSGTCHKREASDRHRLLTLELPPAHVLQKEKS